MNVKRFLSDASRRQIDAKIDRLVVNHKLNQTYKNPLNTLNSQAQTYQSKDEDPSIDIKTEHGKNIYYEKCKDLKLKPNASGESRFVEQFLNSIYLKSLRFSGLGLGPRCIKYITELMSVNNQFVYCDLSLNRLGDDGAKILGSYLGTNLPLIFLDLRSNRIGIEGCVAIFEGLRNNTHLTDLDLSAIDGIDRNRIGTLGCTSLATVISLNQTLSSINLSMSGVTADGCAAIGKAFVSNSSIVNFDLSGNRFGSDGANSLFEFDGSLGMIENLSLSKNGIGDKASQSLCRQLQLSLTIRSLDLSGNEFGIEFLRKFIPILSNSPLESLNLAKNRIGSNSGDLLNSLIRENPRITSLNLSFNPLKDETIVHIAEGLFDNSSLISLDLSETGMESKGIQMIAKALEEHKSLQRLSLASNKINDDDGVILAESLQLNEILVVLNLRNNELKDETAVKLLEVLSTNSTISDLDITYNDFSYRYFVRLSQAIEEHKTQLHSNIAELASRHIDWLKQEEKKLFEYNDKIKIQEKVVEETTAVKNSRLQELADLKAQKREEIDAIASELDLIKQDYDQITEQRRSAQKVFNEKKLELETQQGLALSKFQGLASKRHAAQNRLDKAKAALKQSQEAGEAQLTAVREELKKTRDFLQQVINQNKIGRQMIEDEAKRIEEEKLAAERAEREALNKESAKSKKTKKKGKKGKK